MAKKKLNPLEQLEQETKKLDREAKREWRNALDETSVNGTFYSSHYDPNFNIEDVRSLLDESKEEQDV